MIGVHGWKLVTTDAAVSFVNLILTLSSSSTTRKIVFESPGRAYEPEYME
jgi:hypothetical protein